MSWNIPYKVASGWNADDEDLIALDPQPASPDGVEWGDIRTGGDGMSSFAGFQFVDLVWTLLILETSGHQREDVLAQLGISDLVASAQLTMQFPDNNGDAIIRNVIAGMPPKTSRSKLGSRGFVVRLSHIHERDA